MIVKKNQEKSQPIAHVDVFVDCHDIGKIEFRNWEKICETSFFEFLGIFLAQKNGGPNCVIFSKMNEQYISSKGQLNSE